MNENVDVSICIVSWNTCEVLRDCLQSLFRNSEKLSIEVVVVDNASTDSTVEMVINEFKEVTLIENKQNLGFSRANNQAIRISSGEFILILNPDIIIKKPLLRTLKHFFLNHTDAGVVGCKLVNLDGTTEMSYRHSFPTPLTELKQGLLIHRLFKGTTDIPNDKKDKIEVAWIIGAFMFFRRDVLMHMGGFDERYFIYTEDADLCYRLMQNGLKVYYVNSIEVIHYHGASSKKQKKHYFSTIMQRQSRYYFMLKYYGLPKAIIYRFIWIFSGFMRGFISAVFLLTTFAVSKNKSDHYLKILITYFRVLLWGLGFEKWTRNPLGL